jgi:hypothetical protein
MPIYTTLQDPLATNDNEAINATARSSGISEAITEELVSCRFTPILRWVIR